MKTIQIHGAPSFSKGKTRAQVVVLVSKGRNRRSVNRHLLKQGYRWVGLNTDERAPELNSRCEAELATADSTLRAAEAVMEALLKESEDTIVIEATEGKPVISDDERANLRAEIEAAQDVIFRTQSELYDAQSALAHVQRECPRQVEFTGVF